MLGPRAAYGQSDPILPTEVRRADFSSVEIEPQKTSFGVYLNGRIPVGAFEIEVVQPSKRWVSVTSQWTMRLGSVFIHRTGDLKMNRVLGLQSLRHKETRTQGAQQDLSQTVTTRKANDRWRVVHRTGDSIVRRDLTVDDAVYSSAPESMFLLVRFLASKGEGRYRFNEISFHPNTDKGTEQAQKESFTVDVHSESTYIHRGVRRAVRVVRAHPAGKEASTFVVDGSGALLAFWVDASPVRFIAGTSEEVGQQVPVAEGIVDVSDPRVAIRTVLEVMVGAQPAERLDEVVDWRSVILKMGKIATPKAMKAFQREVKVKFISTPPPFRLEEIPRLIGMMDVVVTSGVAQVRMHQNESPFLLEIRDEKWWIVGLPIQ